MDGRQKSTYKRNCVLVDSTLERLFVCVYLAIKLAYLWVLLLANFVKLKEKKIEAR